MHFDLMLLDFDGTLADTRAAVIDCMEATLSLALGDAGPVSKSCINDIISSGATLPGAFERFMSGHSDNVCDIGSLVTDYRERYARASVNLTLLYPGVNDMLDFLACARIPCVLVSNKGEAALRHALSGLHIAHYFAEVVGETPSLSPKPDPSIFEQVIRPKYQHVERSRVLMVGDTLADLQFADSAGIEKCWARYGYGDERQCRARNPKFEIADAYQLIRIVSGQC